MGGGRRSDEFAEVRLRAAELRVLAVEAADDEAVHRCDMLLADILLREGHLGPGGHSAHQTLEWAEKQGRPMRRRTPMRRATNRQRTRWPPGCTPSGPAAAR